MASNGVSYWGNRTMLQSATSAEVVFRNLFLSIPMFVGSILNILIAVIVARHHNVRHIPMNKFLLNLTVTCVIDSVINLPFVLSTSIYQDWATASGFCVANMFFIYLADTEYIIALFLLGFDRYILARDPQKYEMRLHYSRAIAIMCLTWFCGLTLGIPMFVTSDSAPSPAYVFVPIFACSYGPNAKPTYVLFLLFFNLIIPFISTCVFYVLILRLEYGRLKAVVGDDRRPNTASSLNTITTIASAEPTNQLGSSMNLIAAGRTSRPGLKAGRCDPELWLELHGYKLTACISVTWCILVLPYAVYLAIQRVSACFSYANELDFTNYPLNTTLFWLRAQFVCITPMLILLLHVGIREKAHALLCCACCQIRKASKVSSQAGSTFDKQQESARSNGSSASSVGLQIPIIYATNEGLHMKTYQNNTLPRNAKRDGEGELERNGKKQNGAVEGRRPAAERATTGIAARVGTGSARKRKMFLNIDTGGSVSGASSSSSTRAIVHAGGDLYRDPQRVAVAHSPNGTLTLAPPSVPCDVTVAVAMDDDHASRQSRSRYDDDRSDGSEMEYDYDMGDDGLPPSDVDGDSDAESTARIASRGNAFELDAHVDVASRTAHKPDEPHNLDYYEYYVEQNEATKRPKGNKKSRVEVNIELEPEQGQERLDSAVGDRNDHLHRKHRDADGVNGGAVHRKHSSHRKRSAVRPDTTTTDIPAQTQTQAQPQTVAPPEKKVHRHSSDHKKKRLGKHSHDTQVEVTDVQDISHVGKHRELSPRSATEASAQAVGFENLGYHGDGPDAIAVVKDSTTSQVDGSGSKSRSHRRRLSPSSNAELGNHGNQAQPDAKDAVLDASAEDRESKSRTHRHRISPAAPGPSDSAVSASASASGSRKTSGEEIAPVGGIENEDRFPDRVAPLRSLHGIEPPAEDNNRNSTNVTSSTNTTANDVFSSEHDSSSAKADGRSRRKHRSRKASSIPFIQESEVVDA